MRTKNINGRLVKVAPQRSCISCRTVGDKRSLVRIVRMPDGTVDVDATGRKAGRGAYLCPKLECWDAGVNGGKLERSLKVAMTKAGREELLKKGNAIVEERIG